MRHIQKGIEMTPYLFLADIDGTLIRTGTPLLPRVKAAAKRFREAGGLLTLCTGRAHLSTHEIAKELEIDLPCVLFGGAVLYDFKTNEAIHATPLPEDTREILARLATACPEMSIQAYTTKRAYVLQSNEVLQQRGIREELESTVTPLKDVQGDIIKLVLTHPDPETLRTSATKHFDTRHDFAFSSTRFTEVVSATANKGNGARLLTARLNVPESRLLSAGDAMTDLSLFNVSAHTYAPENALEAVRAKANTIIPICDQGGMAEAFDHATRLMNE